ncbi:MAG TPA: sigma-70 family RNA polymerase sigma factor [Rhizomicrobium sp.]|nr:sigma-70 family RNA polymerase sigma factor [Rhizomicrobium sp.]
MRGAQRRWRIVLREQLPIARKPDGAAMREWSACIVTIAASRDRAQFALLFAHFAPRLKGYFMRLGVSPDIAEDLAQDALLAVWRKAEMFDPARASASTWIFTIARNLRVDLQRRARDPRQLTDGTDSVPEPMPSDIILSAEREDRVRAALANLSPDQADVIRLSFFEERPQSEIAKVLDIPLGTVKSRVRLAMSRLRALVEDLQ